MEANKAEENETDGEVDVEDEAEEGRDSWGSQLEFILTCVGFAVGLGNVWRFPYLCLKNGGGAFLIPYFICIFIIGIPLFYMEICLGQYSSLGPLKVWRLNPWFKGIGASMLALSSLIAVYYAVIIAYCAYYFFASMRAEVPWKYCDTSWSTCNCRDGHQNDSLGDPWNGTRPECSNFTYTENETVASSDEYFYKHVVQMTETIEDAQGLKWDITLCNLFVWTVALCVLSKGIKSLGKVVYFTAIFPYFLLTALLVRGMTLEGYMDGIKFYLTPDFNMLTKAEVWSDAAVQIFYSIGTCVGGLIAMSSYNDFNNNILRDAFLVPIINCLTSFYSGFVTFSILGFMAHRKGVTVPDVATGGPGLAFIVYPAALSEMPLTPIWAVLFFLMMMILGFSTIFSMTETVITGIYDQVEEFMNQDRKRLYIFRVLVCSFFFFMGMPMTVKGGLYMLNLLDTYVGGFPLLIVGIIEAVVIVYFYGINFKSEATKEFPKSFFRGFFHFKSDIELMLGKGTAVTVTMWYFCIMWCFISPISLLLVVILTATQYTPITLGTYTYPEWANILGWLIVVFPLIFIPAGIVYHFVNRDISMQCFPTNQWGPSEKPKPEWCVFIHPYKRSLSRLSLHRGSVRVHMPPRKTMSAPNLEVLVEKDEDQEDIDLNDGYNYQLTVTSMQ